jgi:polysaccharide biosynthesis protein PslG
MSRFLVGLPGVLGVISGLALLVSCAAVAPMSATVSPNLAQAREEGFHLISGHPPFTVDFSAEVTGGDGRLTYAWDLDGDGTADSDAPDPELFTYTQPGEYKATLKVADERGHEVLTGQRIVVIGEPEWPNWRFGLSDHLDRAHGLYANDAEVEKAAALIAEAGIEVVRLDLRWATVQPENRNSYEWDDYDYLVDLSEEYGFELLPVLDYSSQWASTARHTPDWETAPPVPAEFAWFTYKAVGRYKDDIHAWQVWNEPNHTAFWHPVPDPVLYTELLKHAYLAAKYADPKAVVVLGGLANEGALQVPPQTFLQTIYEVGGREYFDAVGRHPYTAPYEGIDVLVGRLYSTRAVMVANGDSEKPIWVTEYGTPAVPEVGITEEIQGAWLTQSLETISSVDNVPVTFWYNFRDLGTDPNDRLSNYGLIENDWEIKPAYEAYRNYISNAR